MKIKIQNALISVYYKDGLEPIVKELHQLGIHIYSTGGTADFITALGIPVNKVEALTGYPSILGGRVKTLHPKVFGGILGRRDLEADLQEMKQYEIPQLDLVMVDLYPFEETLKAGGNEAEIIEKIDIGGVSLIRAAAKNYHSTLIVSRKEDYATLLKLLIEQGGHSEIEHRKQLATTAFYVTSAYDGMIQRWFENDPFKTFITHSNEVYPLRYGENPHQKGVFFGNPDDLFMKHHGKELSYNNLNDLDAALGLLHEFTEQPACIIVKHTNACGAAVRANLTQAWRDALAGDPVSAFGGVIAVNRVVDVSTAQEMDQLFFEIVAAPGFEPDALEILKTKKNRMILELKGSFEKIYNYKPVLNGMLFQEEDNHRLQADQLKLVTNRAVSATEMEDLIFADKIIKHVKSNSIVLARGGQLLGLGCGMTSRIDALKHAIHKASEAGLDLTGAAMASDAFFPFPDCVEVAHQAGITHIIQPGGSVKDQLSVSYCNQHQLSMVFSGIRHFRH